MAKLTQKSVALIHDYLAEYGGAERVLEALHELYPQAPVYVGFLDKQRLGKRWSTFADWDIRPTWLQKIPGITYLFSPLRILAPTAFAQLDLSAYDLVISSSNAYYAKAARVPNGTHVCYCHTPPRALYGYSAMTDWRHNPFLRFFGTLMNHYLRIVDVQLAQRVDYFIANSRETQHRITKFYRRESVVINPPVETQSVSQGKTTQSSYYLYVNRLAFAKHPELAVAVCTKNNWPLKVVGEGKILPQLQAMAGETVEFLGAVDDRQLAELYQHADALLYPVEDEDFGMVPVEAMLHGTPVIAHSSGGPLETIIGGETGVFFTDLTVTSLERAIKAAKTVKFQREQIRQHAQQFSKEVFLSKLRQFLASLINTQNLTS